MSYEKVLKQSHIDAVYIGLPNHLHHEWTIKALEAGKHVLCEKPMAMTLEQGLEMEALANARGLMCAEAFMYRHHPQMATVKRLLKELGQVVFIRSQFSYTLTDSSNIRLRPECGGGALMDVGCYGVDVARYLLEEEPLQGQCMSLNNPEGVDVQSSVQLQFPSGTQAHVFCAMNSERCHRLEVLGSEGHLEVKEAFIPHRGKMTHVLWKGREGQKVLKHDGVDMVALKLDAFTDSVQQKALVWPLENGVANAKAFELFK
jgi:predicted dehydrogenase